MAYQKKIVLHCPRGYAARIDVLIQEFMCDGVRFVGVVGADCVKIEDVIDEIVIGDGSRDPYEMITSSHPGETVLEAVEFAELLTGELAGDVQTVEI